MVLIVFALDGSLYVPLWKTFLSNQRHEVTRDSQHPWQERFRQSFLGSFCDCAIVVSTALKLIVFRKLGLAI